MLKTQIKLPLKDHFPERLITDITCFCLGI